jgi:hypothetical protein
MTATTYPGISDVGVLLRGEPDSLRAWIEKWDKHRLLFCAGIIFTGAGLYGAAMGWWRDPRQALFVAIKFPLIILLTTIGNGLLNAMFAPLLGVNIGLRQSILAILMSFTIAAAILGSFSPLIAFLVWNAPPLTIGAHISDSTYGVIQLSHVLVIAFAGIVANIRLVQLLHELGGSVGAARRVLVAWLAGNLFLGSQLSWIFRPFIGSPGLAVEFLRDHPLKGSFYETVFRSAAELFKTQ